MPGPGGMLGSGGVESRVQVTSTTSTRDSVIVTGLFTAGGVDIASSGQNGTDLIKVPGGPLPSR